MATVAENVSPYVARLTLMWEKMRQTVIDNFPTPASVPTNIAELLKQLDDKYTEDAYQKLTYIFKNIN